MKNPGKKPENLGKSKPTEHEITNEEQWVHDVNEEFAEDIPPLEYDIDNLDFDDEDD